MRFLIVIFILCISFNHLQGQIFIPNAFWGPPFAILSISDGVTYDYGLVPKNANAKKTFTVSNTGKYIANTMSAAAFGTTRFAFTGGSYPGTTGTCGAFLSAGASCTISVTANSSTIATFNDTITLNYNDGRVATTTTRDVTAQFSPEWLNSTWGFRKKLTVDSTKVLEDLTDFPVYVNLANMGAHFFSNVRADGGDIRVTKSDGITEVPREIVHIDTALNTGEIHFKAAGTLPMASNTDFYIYYNKPAATEPAASATYGKYNTWNSNYITVWHMKDDTGATSYSSNSASNDATFTSTLPNNVTGPMPGTAQNFNGSSDRLTVPATTSVKGLAQYTISAWMRTTSVAGTHTLYEEQQGSAATSRLKFGLETNNFTLRIRDVDGSAIRTAIQPAVAIATATWYHVVAIYDATADVHRMIINGTSYSNALTVASISNTNPTGTSNIGARPTGAEWWSGDADELRISNTFRSLNWGYTEYNNQSSPATFYSVATQEAYPP